MNSKISILAVLLTILTLMSSCLNDDTEEGTYYNDAAVTNFTLGTLKRIMHTKTKYTKVDSTYESTISCSSYAFTIDQEKGLIYNLDSLPVGTCTDKALVTISSANSSYVYLKSFTSDSVYYYSSSSDSLDFSQPRVIQVVSTDGTNIKSYTVDVRVHTETSDSLYWELLTTNTNIAKLENMHSNVFMNTIYVYGTVNGIAKAYCSNVNDGKTWKEFALPSTSVLAMANDGVGLYVLTADSIYRSVTGGADDMNNISANPGLKTLLNGVLTEICGISNDNKILKSVDNGVNWMVDATDDDYANLPARDICSFSRMTKTNDNIYKVIVMGNCAEVKDSCCVVWSKVIDADDAKETQPWMYQPFYSYQWHNGPALDHMSIAPYDDGILMIGGKGLGTCQEDAFETIYFSRDDGQNWWEDDRFFLPNEFSSDSTSFTMATDDNNYIWILCGQTGQIWKGHLSQLTWE